ncbi:hypothetical protein JCM17846_23240 [Iodidimonas nitroreducens]|uniref:Uncharacterized protein n=1 Tax=Iodidimonas nitroreducens TaxID=1236968 RepID=A0A5A7N8G7_9PROT|nr:hypothetical protein JCM17846_23240 [Iodidimonas nitroreducens]
MNKKRALGFLVIFFEAFIAQSTIGFAFGKQIASIDRGHINAALARSHPAGAMTTDTGHLRTTDLDISACDAGNHGAISTDPVIIKALAKGGVAFRCGGGALGMDARSGDATENKGKNKKMKADFGKAEPR